MIKLGDRVAYITHKIRGELGTSNTILVTYRPGPTAFDGYYQLQATRGYYKVFILRAASPGTNSQVFLHATKGQ